MTKWFIANKLAINLGKINIIIFIPYNWPQYTLSIGHDEKYIEESVNTKFLGLKTDNHLNWKNHIDHMIPKLSRACYAVRLMFHISNIDNPKSIYFAYFHSIMKYGITFWGNSSNSKMIFTLQRRIVRVTAGAKPRNSCRSLFMRSEILLLPCE
jgi:hypothetical protein